MVIPCTYEIFAKDGEVERVKTKLTTYFQDFKGTETLVIDNHAKFNSSFLTWK